MSAVITIRVPKDLKEAMQKLADRADWPEYLRNALSQKVRQLELEQASNLADRIRAKTSIGAFDSVQSVRRDRGR